LTLSDTSKKGNGDYSVPSVSPVIV
jgi:hypothetical protein